MDAPARQPPIPTLDLRRFDRGDTERASFLDELRSAARGIAGVISGRVDRRHAAHRHVRDQHRDLLELASDGYLRATRGEADQPPSSH